jgi:hypothetical protein
MGRYDYVTQKAKGAPYIRASIDAASAAELNLRLINLNRPVIHVESAERQKINDQSIRVSLRTKLTFIEQLETSAYLGMDFRTALTICLNTTSQHTKTSRRMASVIAELRDRVSRGSSFSQAIRVYPQIFDDVAIGLISAGEEGGTLSEALTNVRKIWARNDDLQHRLLMMLIYPVIVMMGEIRDEESVDALMRLSSSGHRAISTLHTNSVCEVPNRFFLFRAQPFMVADSLKMAISQRLVKKVCPRCYIEEPVPSEERLIRLGIQPNWLHGVNALRRGRKCDFCRQTGVSGRKAIFEALIVDDEVKIAIQEQAPAVQLRRILEAKGEAGLFERAVREAASGVISLEEACKFREVGATDHLNGKESTAGNSSNIIDQKLPLSLERTSG